MIRQGLAAAALGWAVLAVAGPASAACAWRPGEVLTLSGTVRSGGLDGTVRRRVELGRGRLFERTDLGVVANAHGYDGRLAWSQDVSGATHDLDSGFARALAVSQAWLDARQGCAPSAGPTAERLAGREADGKSFEAWRVTPRGGAPMELWYDARTGRLDRALLQTAETRLIRHFDDWREVGRGRLVAFAQRDEFPEDEDEVVYRFTRARLAPRAAKADFRRPPRPHDVRMLGGARATTVPFEDDHRTRVYVPVYLNGKGPFTFELDNGGHFIVSEDTAKAAGLTAAGAFNSTGAGTAVAKTGFARVKSLRIGQAEIVDQPARVRALSAAANDRGPRPPRAGLLGLELFERFVVGIDQRARTVTLRPLGAPYPKPKGTPLPLVFAEDAPLVAGAYQGVAGDFMLDTGNAGATIVEDFWASAHGLTPALKQGMSLSGVTFSRGDIGIGSFTLPGETVSYYGPAERGSEYSRAVAGVYGQPLLSRFNALYDYGRKTVWLEPLPEMGVVRGNRAGLAVARNAAGELAVAAVAEGSPAAEAGLKTGDLVLEIAGHPAKTLSRADAAALFQQAAGTDLELRIASGGAERTAALRLRDLF
jgi:hypothetical protein